MRRQLAIAVLFCIAPVIFVAQHGSHKLSDLPHVACREVADVAGSHKRER